MLQNAVAVVNGKGGVGKTTLTANLAALLAVSGWQVLAVDADPQGNLGVDLGYRGQNSDDEGAALARLLAGDAPLTARDIISEVRPGLSVLPGGREMRPLLDASAMPVDAFSKGLAPAAAANHLLLIDCPPEIGVITKLVMAASRTLIVPVLPDDASVLGLEPVAQQVGEMQAGVNPDLVLLGVVMMQIPSAATRLLDDTRKQIEEHGLPVFDTSIRFSRRAAADCRRRGVVAHEYADIALSEVRERLEALSRKEKPVSPKPSSAAAALAADYSALTAEVANAITALMTRRRVGE